MDEHDEQSGPSRVGEVLGDRWRLEERLGGGGMGEVYRAVHLALGRTVAIKVLRREQAWNATSARRVLREGQAASRVLHPNIVRIEDVGVDAHGLPYLVQEFLDGCDLDAYSVHWRGVVPPRALLPLMIPALDALGALHDAGILHRDLKPGNVFLVREGDGWSPRLLDFGLATLADDASGQHRITTSTMTLGSPAYMSPEQFRDPRTLTPRSDLWSFGVMFYELLTGVLPFTGVTVGAVAIAVSTEAPVPIGERSPTLPPALGALVMRCLEKDPARRPASVRELMAVCAEVLAALPPVDPNQPVEPTDPGPTLTAAATRARVPFDSTRPALHAAAPVSIADAPTAPVGRARIPRGPLVALAAVALGLALRYFARPEPAVVAPVARPPSRPTVAAAPAVDPPSSPPREPAVVPIPVVAHAPVTVRVPPRPTAHAAPRADAGVAPPAPPVAVVVAPTIVAPTAAPREPAPPVATPLGVGIDPNYR